MTDELTLRYGCNPYQTPARVFMNDGPLPFTVLNGAPGYINLLDAFNSWQLVKELKQILHLPAAASFKHVSPAGAAVGLPLSDTLKTAYGVEDLDLSPLGAAYARARGADRLSSYGDWVALSDVVDRSTARLLSREVSDGIIAPGYEPDALALLRKKRSGKYIILEIDPSYEAVGIERREVFGVTFEQGRNTFVPTAQMLADIPTRRKTLPVAARRDALLGMITLKYTQSNSICLSLDGQCIGIGAGQQSRIQCARLAGAKAAVWYLRQHPTAMSLPFKQGVKRQDQVNAVEEYVRDEMTPTQRRQWGALFEEVPRMLTIREKQEWLEGLQGVVLGSDGYIPFRDTIDCAARYGVSYVVQPGGSLRDQDVTDACDAYDMVMSLTGVRCSIISFLGAFILTCEAMGLWVDELGIAVVRDQLGPNTPLRLGFLASHGGSGMAAIIKAIDRERLDASARVLISNNNQSRALGIAQEAGIPTCHLSATIVRAAEDLDRAIRDTLIFHGVTLVVCSGYMKKIGMHTLTAFKGRILNVHPALLPAFGGQGMYGARVHAAVLAAGETTTGVTVHVVDEEYDRGPILAQAAVPVLEIDTIDTLAGRVLDCEKTLYVEVLQRLVNSGEGTSGLTP